MCRSGTHISLLVLRDASVRQRHENDPIWIVAGLQQSLVIQLALSIWPLPDHNSEQRFDGPVRGF